MTQDEVIAIARQVRLPYYYQDGEIVNLERLEAFAKLVEAHTRGQIFKPDWDNYRQGLIDGAVSEREACAAIVEREWSTKLEKIFCDELVEYIRARGEA